MHWIKLPSGDRLNLEMPDYVRAGGRIALAGGSFVASGADRAEINRQIDATIAVREEDMAALDGLVRELRTMPPPDPEATFARLKERLPAAPGRADTPVLTPEGIAFWAQMGTNAATLDEIARHHPEHIARPASATDTPSTHLAAGMRRAEEVVFQAIRDQVRADGLDAAEASALIEAVRVRLYRQDADTGPLDVPTEVDALGASEVARLDLRQGDDVLNLRYDGIRYCAAIKTRFGGETPAGLPDCYAEISYLDPQDGVWYVLGRFAAPPEIVPGGRFFHAIERILAHDRDTPRTSS